MAEDVTYADLRFTQIPLGKIQLTDGPAGNVAEDGDLTYENVTGPKQPRVRTAPPAPPTGLVNQLRTGFWAPSWPLTLILLLLCLLFLASSIGLTVKYIDLSHQFYQSQQLTERLTQNLQRKEQELSAEKHRMEKIQEKKVNDLKASLLECDLAAKRSADEKKELSWEINHLNTSLLESQRREKESIGMKEAVEERLKDICPKDWILFGGKCLRFTNEEGIWEKCDESCKRMDGNLIVVQKNDESLQGFLSTKAGDAWVGKEFRLEGGEQSWKWPNQYRNDWRKCWQIRNGNLMLEKCSETKKCVCEKNLILVTVKKWYTSDYPQFNLWDTPYHCWKN